MREGVSKTQQAVLSSLIVIEVHAKDVVSKLVEQKVLNINDFEWISQLRFALLYKQAHFYHLTLLRRIYLTTLFICRYYWTNEELHIHAMNAEFLYGYEYLGNSSRMVITPLTNR